MEELDPKETYSVNENDPQIDELSGTFSSDQEKLSDNRNIQS